MGIGVGDKAAEDVTKVDDLKDLLGLELSGGVGGGFEVALFADTLTTEFDRLEISIKGQASYGTAVAGLINEWGGSLDTGATGIERVIKVTMHASQIPLIASATATFLFRQIFLVVPDELTEAARIDGAGPIRFFVDILLPLSRTNIAALFVIMFVYGCVQYLWPLLITTDEKLYTILIGINRMLAVGDAQAQWQIIMATTMLAMLPPVAVVIFMQKLFVKGLTETEK